MSTTVFTEPIAYTSLNFKARTAGFFWLLSALTGSFAMIAFRKVVISADPATTAANLMALEPLFRLGLAANLVATLCYLGATLLVYALLKPVNGNLSLLAAVCSLTGCASGLMTFVFDLAPLAVMERAQYLSIFVTPQLRSLTYTLLRLDAQASSIAFAVFGLHCLITGCLILASAFKGAAA